MLDRNILEDILKTKLLIKYQTSKTLGENLSFINEQKEEWGYEIGKEMGEEEQSKKYPNYCKYPNNAVYPPKWEELGEESIVKVDRGGENEIPFCLYTGMGGGGYWIPKDSEIKFSAMDILSYNIDIFLEKYPDYLSEEDLLQNLSQLFFPQGVAAVKSFNIGNVNYNSSLIWDSGMDRWRFRAYIDEKRNDYPNPVWNDPRTEWDIIVDKFGTAVYFGALIITTFVAPYLFELTLPQIWFMIGADLALSSIISQRAWEKGENVSAVLGMVFCFLPALQLSNKWLGVSDEVAKSLSQKLLTANLNKNSKAADWVKWYRTKLKDSERLAFTKFLRYDKNKLTNFSDDIIKQFGKKGLRMSQSLPSGIQKILQEAVNDPKLLKSIPFWERLGVKNFTLITFLLTLSYIVNKIYGKELNDETKMTLTNIQSIVSPEIVTQIMMAALMNTEKVNEIFSGENGQFITNVYNEAEEAAKNLSINLSPETKDSIVVNNVNRFIDINDGVIPDSTETSIRKIPIYDNPDETKIQNLRDEGYFTEKEIQDSTLYGGSQNFVDSVDEKDVVQTIKEGKPTFWFKVNIKTDSSGNKIQPPKL